MLPHYSVSKLLVALVLCCVDAREPGPEVKAPAGTFRGKILTSHSGADYASYRGIPFALPPTGGRRFALPEPYPVIEDVHDATEFASPCLQHANGATLGQEDCLFLNVYTPLPGQETGDANLKKVLIFIHGGGLVIGASNLYLPGDLVTRGDVIVVTINYRLSWLGFLRGNSSSLHGNQAYWDQLLALKWVKNNIRAFGGDPSDVTLSGESAGSMSTHILSISPLAKDLFSKAILQSGSALTLSSPARTSNDLLQAAATSFGCGVDSVTGREEDVVTCLKQLPAETFALRSSFPLMFIFTSSEDDLLPKPLTQLMSDSKYLSDVGFFNRDFVVSITREDGYVAVNSPFGKIDTTSLESFARGLSGLLKLPLDVVESVLLEYEKLYGDLEKAGIALATDELFLRNSLIVLDVHRNRPSQGESTRENSAYLMSFDNSPRYVPNQYALHAAELVYLFDLNPKEFLERFYFIELEDAFYDEDIELKSDYIDLVTAFLKTGNPGENLTKQKNVVWPPYDSDKRSYLSFSLQPSVGEDIIRNRRAIWQKLLPQWLQYHERSENRQEL